MKWMALAIAGVLTLLLVHQAGLAHKLRSLQTEFDTIAAELQSQNRRLEEFQTGLAEAKSKTAPVPDASLLAAPPDGSDQSRLLALERQLQNLSRALVSPRSGLWVPEYDPTLPVTAEAVQTNSLRRDWGPEQITGPPDTDRGADAVTAWASLEANAGAEWLSVDFITPVPVAEVRIRESFNPGAISKVTALVNGQEIVLWEGTAASGRAPRDFVVHVREQLATDSVRIQLDTTRVQGWNEIDAVELVGRDGSRQWAASARASSTWAERNQNQSRSQNHNPIIELQP